MIERAQPVLDLALPSKGQLERPTLDFLRSCGLAVLRPNVRQYVASIPAVPEVRVLFQRTADIFRKVEEGTVDLGITGFDIVSEKQSGHENCVILQSELGYGECELVLAVPESWIDVTSVADVADLAFAYKNKGRELRVSTKYPVLTRKWFFDQGIYHFTIVDAEGAHEAAPAMGYAEMIVDVSTSGTTLKENRLKKVSGGTLIRSEACLIANRANLANDGRKLAALRPVVERMEAHLRSRGFLCVSANIASDSRKDISKLFRRRPHLAGLRGPTIAKVYPQKASDKGLYSVKIIVAKKKLTDAVDDLRKAGATDITVSSLDYIFESKSWTYEGFLEMCRKEHSPASME